MLDTRKRWREGDRVLVIIVVFVFALSQLVVGTCAAITRQKVSNRTRLAQSLLQGYSSSQPPEVEGGLQVRVQFALINVLQVSVSVPKMAAPFSTCFK